MEQVPGGHMSHASISLEDMEKQLVRKRKALDHEIEKFMALKDAEYRRFEKELRNQCGTAPTQEKDESSTAGADQGSHGRQSKQSTSVQRGSSREDHVQSPLGTTTSPTSNKDVNAAERKDPLMTANGIDQDVNREDRELEARGLFIPSFLPLLDGLSHQSVRGHRRMLSTGTGTRAKRRSVDLETESQSLSTSLTNISSGAKLESSSLDSQIRPTFGDRRSSSSPTGTGRSLRKSSLRQPASPDKIPKERKHVLFSIDNVVISPSSSPVSTRTTGVEDAKTSRKPPIPFSGLQDWPAGAQGEARDAQPADGPSAENLTSPVPIKPTPASPMTPFSRSYKDLIEPTMITPSEELDKEDLTIVDDPLFSADEGLPLEVDEEWENSGREEEKSDGYSQADLAASPHVGSVPIEIRWPGRRTS